jgi:uncharacterized LabA/DUF88 family protein
LGDIHHQQRRRERLLFSVQTVLQKGIGMLASCSIMERAETAEVIVLTSGAGDFDLLVNKIRGQYGKQLTFMAPRR